MDPTDKNETTRREPLEVPRSNKFNFGPVAATTAVAAVAAVAVASILALIIPGLVERYLLEAEATSIQDTVDQISRSIDSSGSLTEADFARLQIDVEHTLLGREIVRVKIWNDTGTIVFSDEERLIGKTYPMTEDLLAAFSGELIFEEPDLTKPENRYEQNFGDLREYYVPVDSGAQGIEAVFEVYEVADRLVDTVADIRVAVWAALGVGAVMLLAALVAAGVANARAERKRQARSERLIGQLIEIREDERTRIVGALHDDIGQPLYRILFGLQASRAMVDESSDVGLELERLDGLVREMDTTLRSELTTLRDEPGVEIDLELALAELIEVTEGGTNLEIEFVSDVDTELPLPHRATLYRAAKEALANVDRHAHASHVTVRLIEGRDTTMIEVIDNGSGAVGSPGLGLTTTKDRLVSIGGGIDISDARGGGAHFTAWVPVDHSVPR
jgi:two-component system NarL family sensor kinase